MKGAACPSPAYIPLYHPHNTTITPKGTRRPTERTPRLSKVPRAASTTLESACFVRGSIAAGMPAALILSLVTLT